MILKILKFTNKWVSLLHKILITFIYNRKKFIISWIGFLHENILNFNSETNFIKKNFLSKNSSIKKKHIFILILFFSKNYSFYSFYAISKVENLYFKF